jgi:hypothetical protein
LMRYSNTVSSYLDMKDINNSVYVRLHLSYVYCNISQRLRRRKILV